MDGNRILLLAEAKLSESFLIPLTFYIQIHQTVLLSQPVEYIQNLPRAHSFPCHPGVRPHIRAPSSCLVLLLRPWSSFSLFSAQQAECPF